MACLWSKGKSTGLDPEFPIGGDANPRGGGQHQHTNLSDFPKLHEIKKILVRKGRAPLDPPLMKLG